MAPGRRVARILLGCALGAMAAASCGPKSVDPPSGRTADRVGTPPAAPQAAPSATDAATRFAALVSAHNTRVSRLETVESRGSLELRYSDEGGEHFEQCEFDVFLAAGGRGALRATKVGNNFLWIGGDGTRGWVFRLDTEPTVLKVYDKVAEHELGQGADGAGEFALLTPGTVRAVAGMQPIPASFETRPVDGADASATVEARSEVVYQAGTAKVFVRFGADGLPSAVRIVDALGAVAVSSTLADYVPAQAASLAQGAWPKLPRRIEITAAKANGRATLLLDEPIAMARRMKPRFFNLEELTAQFRPDRVEHAIAIEAGGVDGGK